MKITTTTPIAPTRLSTQSPDRGVTPQQTADRTEGSTEEPLTDMILQLSNGHSLIKFCRELSVTLVRHYSLDDNATDLRDCLIPSIKTTLTCTEQQAGCLIDLTLEMIHAKVHGAYRRTEVELSYLIATATGAVTDVAAN